MRRILTTLLTVLMCSSFLLVTAENVPAVEKKEKPKTESSQKGKKSNDSKSGDVKSDKGKKKYDDFIDKNKNGIDDRREHLKSKDNGSSGSKKPDSKPEKKSDEKSKGKKGG